MNFRLEDSLAPPAELLGSLRSRDNFLVSTHVNPDGDAIGSAIALAIALEKMGKKTVLVDKHPIPEQYRFLPGQERFHTYESLEAAGYRARDFGALLILDCNDPERIGLEKKEQHPAIEDLKKAVADGMYAVVIDHHENEKDYGNIRWVVPKAAAAGMMVYYLIKSLGVSITVEMATNLYTAIVIDTGNFRYENATSEVFRVAAELIDYGAVPSIIYEDIYEAWSDNRFKLYLRVIESLEIIGGVAIATVMKRMLEETSTVADDTENFVAFPRIMKNIKISVLFREVGKDEYKVSLRSKGDIDVARIAVHFNGGGHKHAAGCRIKADIDTAKAMILGKIKALPHY